MTVTENPNNLKDGRVVAIAGPVVDVVSSRDQHGTRDDPHR
jgi:hypothetical protein